MVCTSVSHLTIDVCETQSCRVRNPNSIFRNWWEAANRNKPQFSPIYFGVFMQVMCVHTNTHARARCGDGYEMQWNFTASRRNWVAGGPKYDGHGTVASPAQRVSQTKRVTAADWQTTSRIQAPSSGIPTTTVCSRIGRRFQNSYALNLRTKMEGGVHPYRVAWMHRILSWITIKENRDFSPARVSWANIFMRWGMHILFRKNAVRSRRCDWWKCLFGFGIY